MSIAIVWFRLDLRLKDNPALFHACQDYDQIIPLYIFDNKWNNIGAAQCWWLHFSLKSLSKSLKKHHAGLVLKQGEAIDVFKKLIREYKVNAVYWNDRYEPKAMAVDKHIKQTLEKNDIQVQCYNGSLFFSPWEIKNKSGDFFKVFTPFWRTCRPQLAEQQTIEIPKISCAKIRQSNAVKDLQLLPHHPNWAASFGDYWQPGEDGAHQQLQAFIDRKIKDYDRQRDIPASDGTSRLSPHLHFGEITPQIIWDYLNPLVHHRAPFSQSIERYLSQLGWREFSYHLLYHFPQLDKKNFKPNFNQFHWQGNIKQFNAWKKGQTGYPIVDAGMRELWHTGYMHNRVRMIVASFLTKDLFIDWKKGAKWFWNTLLDADVANNYASWQWVAGSGADALPYFRIFNPILQAKKFDPQGKYIKKWVPELSNLPEKYVHQPWLLLEAPIKEIDFSTINYPLPIVDHDQARKKALSLYKQITAITLNSNSAV